MHSTTPTLLALTLLSTTLTTAAPTAQSDPSTFQSPGMFTLYNTAPGAYANFALVAVPSDSDPDSRELHFIEGASPSPAYLNGTADQFNTPGEYAYLNFAGDQARTEFSVSRPEIGDEPGTAESFFARMDTTSFRARSLIL